jgi:hypothetical protein
MQLFLWVLFAETRQWNENNEETGMKHPWRAALWHNGTIHEQSIVVIRDCRRPNKQKYSLDRPENTPNYPSRPDG